MLRKTAGLDVNHGTGPMLYFWNLALDGCIPEGLQTGSSLDDSSIVEVPGKKLLACSCAVADFWP